MRSDKLDELADRRHFHFFYIEAHMHYVVGCNHGIQPSAEDWLAGDTPDARDQKTHFSELIQGAIRQHGIRFVGEEWGPADMTIAHAAALAYGVPWSDINTTPDDLDCLRIPRDYVNGNYTDAQKRRWHREREEVMLHKLREGRRNAENLLVVCGFRHFEPITELLRHDNSPVTPIDYRAMDWYRPGVFSCDP